MARSGLVQYREQGNAVLVRLTVYPAPNSMTAAVHAFRTVHVAYEKASDAVEEARVARDEALAELADQDAALDELLEALAGKSIAAGFGSRQRPMGRFTTFSVSRLRGLAYKVEADEILSLTEKIVKETVPKAMRDAAAACAKQANAVLACVAALTKPQYAYATALARRDALLVDWTRAYGRLKKSAAVAWFDEPATYEAVFAAPDAIAVPKTRRAKKKPTE